MNGIRPLPTLVESTYNDDRSQVYIVASVDYPGGPTRARIFGPEDQVREYREQVWDAVHTIIEVGANGMTPQICLEMLAKDQIPGKIVPPEVRYTALALLQEMATEHGVDPNRPARKYR